MTQVKILYCLRSNPVIRPTSTPLLRNPKMMEGIMNEEMGIKVDYSDPMNLIVSP